MPPPGSVCDYRHIVTLKKLAAQEEAGWFSLVKMEAGNIFIFIFSKSLEESSTRKTFWRSPMVQKGWFDTNLGQQT